MKYALFVINASRFLERCWLVNLWIMCVSVLAFVMIK